MKTGSKLKPYKLLLTAQNPQNPQSKLLDHEIKVKQKPNKQKSLQVAVFNRSLQNPKTPNPQNPKKERDFSEI
jgi:hypothetical protein